MRGQVFYVTVLSLGILTLVFAPAAIAQPVSAFKTDALTVDNNMNGIADPGDTVTYTVVITNETGVSRAVLTNVTFTAAAVVDAALVVGSVTTDIGSVTVGNTGGDTTVGVDIGTLDPDETVTITFSVVVDDPLPPGTDEIECQGFVSGDTFTDIPTDDPDTFPPDDPTATPVAGPPEMMASKSDALQIDQNMDGTADPGDTLLYTVFISNEGGPSATSVVYTVPASPDATLNAGSVTTSQGTVTTGNGGGDTTISIDVGTIDDGDFMTITYEVVVDLPLPAAVTEISCQGTVSGANFVDVLSDDPDTPADDDPTLTPVGGAPDVNVTKADSLLADTNGDGFVGPGDTVRYTVVLTNSGDRDASSVVFSAPAVANAALVMGSVTTTQGTVTTGNRRGGPVVEVDLGTLVGAGGMATITFDVIVDFPLPVTVTEISCQGTASGGNFADVLSDDPDTPAAADPTLTPIVASPDVDATKTDSLIADGNNDGSAGPGDTVRYTIVLTNNGGSDASSVLLSVPAVANTALIMGSVTTTQGTVTTGNRRGGPVVEVDLGTLLGGGGTATITYDVALDDPWPDGVTEISCQGLVSGGNFTTLPTDDPDTAPLDDPTLTPVVVPAPGMPLVEATKVGIVVVDGNNDGIADPGETLEYVVVLSNTGTGDADAVTYSDVPDPNTTLVEGSVMTGQGVVTSGNGPGEMAVGVDVGTIAPSGTVTLSYRATVRDPLPDGVLVLVNQGTVSGANFVDEPTDDPATVADDDPTVLAAGTPGPVVEEIPTVNEWGLLALVLLLAGLGLRRLRVGG